MVTETRLDGTLRPAQRTVRQLTTANVVADHAALVGGSYKWVRTLLRTQSVTGRAILAHLASGGWLTSRDLETLPSRRDHDAVLELLDLRTTAFYARVLAHQPGPPSEEETAIELLALVLDVDYDSRVTDADVTLYAQLLAKHSRRSALEAFLRREELVARVPADIIASLRADLASPFLGGDASEARFLELFNTVIDPADAGVVTLRDSGATPFDRLGSTASDTEHGPLITVVTSTFNPDHALIVAARSMIDQTWASWEMLVVDDASTDPAASAILAETERMDPRIRVIRKAVNGGTYRARNTAMRHARGSFVTFLDSDDWAHPHRLATGVHPMIEQPGVIATRTYGTRVTEELELTRPGYAAHFTTAPSLMFRFPDVPARIGFFDTARKAADTEYTLRIEVAFGRRVVDLPGRALTLLRRTDDSLSAADFSFGWRHPSRWAYKQAYGAVHREIAAGADPFAEPDGASPYFGAHRWAKPGDQGRPASRHFDVVFVGDWRRYGGPQVSMMEEITALRAHGLRIGVMHLEAMRFRTERDEPLCEPLRARLRSGEVELVFVDDDVDIDVMVLRYPPILQFPPAVTRAARPRRLLIMANQAPAEPDGRDQRYVPADVHRHAIDLFDAEPLWVPQGPTIRRILAGLLPADVIAPWDNQGIIDAAEWYTERRPLPVDGLVVGRHSRDDAIKFPPTAAELLTGYGFPPEVDVRLMGATKAIGKLFRETEERVPGNWTVLDGRAVPAKEFLAGLDVVLYLDNPNAHEAFGRVLLESAASGALVIASPKHEQTFGDALLYAEPADAVTVVRRCVTDPELVARQRELTRRRVRERWSYASFAEPILAELASVGHREPGAPASPVAPAGEVFLRRTNGRRPIDVVSPHREVEVLQAPLRRLADAELADAIAVLHGPGGQHAAADLLTDIRAAHRPGDTALDLDELPTGVVAVVLHADGRWWLRPAAGWRASVDGDACQVTADPGHTGAPSRSAVRAGSLPDRQAAGIQRIETTFFASPEREPDVQEVENATLTTFARGCLRVPWKQPSRYITGAVYDAPGRLVVDSQRVGGLANDHALAADAMHLPDAGAVPMKSLPGTWLYGGHWMNHFGHFLTETVTTLWTRPGVEGIVFHPFWFGDRVLHWQADALRLLGISPDAVVIVGTERLQAERLLVPTRPYVPNGYALPETVRVWREMARNAQAGRPAGGRHGRVFFSRAAHHRSLAEQGRMTKRAAENEEEIDELFARRGFRVVHAETMSLTDQVRVAASADVLAGVSGSALHLSVFAAPGATVLEMGDVRNRPSPVRTQQILAKACGHDLWFLRFSGAEREYDVRRVESALEALDG